MIFISSLFPSAYSPPPTTTWAALGLPSPSPRVCRRGRAGVRTKFSRPHGFTKNSYPWCSAGALRAQELRYEENMEFLLYFSLLGIELSFITQTTRFELNGYILKLLRPSSTKCTNSLNRTLPDSITAIDSSIKNAGEPYMRIKALTHPKKTGRPREIWRRTIEKELA